MADAEKVAVQLASLETMGLYDLKQEWERRIGAPPPGRTSETFMRRVLAQWIQEQAYGGLSPAVRRKLKAIAAGDEMPARPSLKKGARLVREWNGVTHQVEVAERGFFWREKHFRSLSAVAREITGARWSGPRFFGLDR
ncbi:DUF2924 domain-containing protein [Euryhalocaulis caribicus]|uniref:DUF2924 domain-containing protein n=1 Tax=Euryhalocaulis caribicus TaxID=1161401 RepID=UPI0003A88C4F|nr:DUF2924 domain-containing protein [Euryhalocaulis caribicus]